MELFKSDAVKFFGIEKSIVSATRTELSQIHLQKNINDWVLQADDDSYIHFEFQTTYSKDDLLRFMVSDAMLYYKEHKRIKTIVVYSADIADTITTLDTGAIQYSVDAFYMIKLNGDKAYEVLKAKTEAGLPLTKQDLMSIVFLPLMKNSVGKDIRLEQSIMLSKTLLTVDEQLQIQAMLELLAEKFITDIEQLKRLKGMMNMGAIAEMIRADEKNEIAKNAIREGYTIESIHKITGLSESTIRDLQKEMGLKNNG